MKCHQGFTLIEVMVVVAIIAILSSIAYPSYQDSVTKSRRSQAKATLLEYAQFMERNFTTTGNYSGKSDGSAIALPSSQGATDLASHYDFSLGSPLTDSSFTVKATPKGGQLAKDARCGTLTFNNVGIKAISGTGIAKDCW
jgi:type IV pilus assembly protein PilE